MKVLAIILSICISSAFAILEDKCKYLFSISQKQQSKIVFVFFFSRITWKILVYFKYSYFGIDI